MARKKFLRADWRFYSKLGKGRKKKQKYRKAKGRHSKIREKMKGNPRRVEIGYKKAKKGRQKEKKIISNIKELLKTKKGEEIIIARVGRKKKIEIAKKAKEEGIKIFNLNTEKFLGKIEREKLKKSQEKGKKEETKEKATEKKEEKKETKQEEKKIKEEKNGL